MEQMLVVKELPESERPRERLIQNGPESLSTSELIAILLRSGSCHENVLSLSQKITKQYDLRKLSRQRVSSLQKISGVGQAKACQIIAAFELGKRVHSFYDKKKKKIESAKDIAKIYRPKLSSLQKEHVIGVFLNIRKEIVREETLFVGTLDSSIIHAREIYHIGILEGASAVILVHNHPSGNPTPSDEDIAVTKELVAAGNVLGIQFLDHIIIGNKKYVSLAEEGLF